jgi:uncharacterized protein (TIGR02594 family)
MRLVTLSSALVLSFAFFSVSQPGLAAPDKKETGKNQAANVAKKPAAAASQSAKASSAKTGHVKNSTDSKKQVMQAANGKPVAADKKSAKADSAKGKSEAKAPAKQAASGKPSKVAKAATRTKADSATKSEARRADTARRSRGASALASVQQQTQTYPDRFGTTDTTGAIPANFPGGSNPAKPAAFRLPHLFASPDPVLEARRWIGTNPTDRNNLWCARFMNFVLERSGYKGTGSDAAKSFASYGHRVSGPRVGAIAVMTRGKYGGHVGIVSGIDEHGNVIVISGNNYGRKVGESTYSRSRIYAYVMPER